MRMEFRAAIVDNHKIARDTYLMSIHEPGIANQAKPGQFVHVKIPNDNSLLLRRPISINGVVQKEGIIDIVYQKVGKGTHMLSRLQSGSNIDIIAPLGKGFSVPAGTKNVFLVGGGCGVAPLKFAAEEWNHLNFYSFLGFQDVSSAYQIDEFKGLSREVYVSTDDGSLGKKGVVTDLMIHKIKCLSPDLILACGPVPMLKVIQRISAEYDIPCQISLEERMGCGIGGCLVCSCAIGARDKWEYKKVCSDGPVFWSQEVVFDE